MVVQNCLFHPLPRIKTRSKNQMIATCSPNALHLGSIGRRNHQFFWAIGSHCSSKKMQSFVGEITMSFGWIRMFFA